MVIADRLAILVSTVFDAPRSATGPAVIIATVLFAYQIYCDFSGYSDIALGTAEVMGVTLMRNFDLPYSARSLGEFWRRWHISLSTWFRDYLFIRSVESRGGTFRTYRNLLIVFVVSGLWHGANWTFVVWGALHGIALICESATADLRRRAKDALRLSDHVSGALGRIFTFAFVCVTWIFFRAASLNDALLLVRAPFTSAFLRPGNWTTAITTICATSG